MIGIVAMGGKSSRMGKDKSWINYHGKPQCYMAYELLENFCSKTFLCCNSAQKNLISKDYKLIEDLPQYAAHGPISALLTAGENFPNDSIFLLGCDYPFIEKIDLEVLINSRDERHSAYCLFNETIQIPEPLIAIYEPIAVTQAKRNFESKNYSLRDLLFQLNSKMIPASSRCISIDTMEASLNALAVTNKS